MEIKIIRNLEQISMYRIEIKTDLKIENEVRDDLCLGLDIDLFMDRYIYIIDTKLPKIIKLIGEDNILSIKNISRSTFKKK